MTQRDKWKKRPCVVAYRQWADRVRQHLAGLPVAANVLSLSWTATFEPPRSWSKKERANVIGTLHRQKPDRDNLDKAVLDILYPGGDQAIASGTIEKRWGWVPSLEIRISTANWNPP
jgi:Holliday junction resolvase RusA-like endonuclease